MFWENKKQQFNIDTFKEELLESLKGKLYKEVLSRKSIDDLVDISRKLLVEEVNQFCEDFFNSQTIIKLFQGTIYEKPSMTGLKKQAAGSLIDYLFATTSINSEANINVMWKYAENNQN